MKTGFLLLALSLLLISYAQAARSVHFGKQITPQSMRSLIKNIEKNIRKLKLTEERVIIIELSSGGGNIQEALRFVDDVARLSQLHGVQINTRVNYSSCESACTILFTAGELRMAGPKSRFGFHSPAIESRLPRDRSREQVLTWARVIWLNAISKVDAQAAYMIQSSNYLLEEEMRFFNGRELSTGYVNKLK